MISFRKSTRDFGCASVHELMKGQERVGIVWQTRNCDEIHHWAAGDGSKLCGKAIGLDAAKAKLLEVIQ